jgi:hypothetical protein
MPIQGVTLTIAALAMLQTTGNLAAAEQEHEQYAAHMHGEANLLVALEGDLLEIELDSPAINIVGFEHNPRDPGQEQIIQQAAAQLRQPDRLFTLPAAAGCVVEGVELHFPQSETPAAGDAGEDHPDEAHQDIEARYRCTAAARLKQITLNLFDLFPATAEVEAQVISHGGQRQLELTKQRNTLEL